MRRLDVNSYGALGRFRLVLLVEALQNGGEVRCAGRRALRTQEHGHAADGFCRLIIAPCRTRDAACLTTSPGSSTKNGNSCPRL